MGWVGRLKIGESGRDLKVGPFDSENEARKNAERNAQGLRDKGETEEIITEIVEEE